MESPGQQERHWFVLNFVSKPGRPSPKAVIDSFNRQGHDLELFAPIIRPARVVNGRVRHVERLLTFFYVFVRGSLPEVKEVCMRPGNEFSLLIDRSSSGRYAVISDPDMENFKIIARTHTNAIDLFNIDDIELSEGDLVEVVGGDYNGLRGVFIPKSRSSKGNLVIAASAAMGTVVWEIDSRTVRILEFARDTRRQYDIVDAFIPRLLPVLRRFHADERLTDREKSQLTVFNSRMGAASIPNHKAEAKLLAVLMCVQIILGDMESLQNTSRRFEKRKTAITNRWTLALTELMLSVALSDMPRLRAAYYSVSTLGESPTKSQSQLLDEFRHYLQAPPSDSRGCASGK